MTTIIYPCIISTLLLTSSYLFKMEQGEGGKETFEINCIRCHGRDGTRGKWGAKNLKQSTITDNELLSIIKNGKKIMPAWYNTLTEKEIKSVMDYVKTLRK